MSVGGRFVKVVVGGVAGALLWAGSVGAQPFPGGPPAALRALQQTQGQLSACTSSLTQTQGEVTECQTDLGTCQAQSVWGDGIVGTGEQCDVGNLDGRPAGPCPVGPVGVHAIPGGAQQLRG